MSSIPPNIVGPILQAGLAQKQAARILDNEREQQEAAAQSTSKLNDRLDVVGETDEHTQVNPDTEGSGSQGKELDAEEENTSEDTSTPKSGITRDDDGHLHVDLEA